MSHQDDQWDVLVRTLGGGWDVREREPHGLVVRTPGPDGAVAEVEIVMTRDQWSDMASVVWGDTDSAAQHVRDLVRKKRGMPYLVHAPDHTLHPSATDTLPVDPRLAELRKLSEQHPDDIPGGRWSAGPPREKRPR